MSGINGFDPTFLRRLAEEHRDDREFQKLVRVALLAQIGRSPGPNTELGGLGVNTRADLEKALSDLSIRVEAIRRGTREGPHGS